jgi:hypothetical protein
MSHHLDTPLARQNGRLYIDDLYVFPGNRSTVFVMDVNSTITGPDVQRGFHPEARYEFKVHSDGADFESLTYRVSFGEADSAGQQALRLHALTGLDARQDTATGELLLEGRTNETAVGSNIRLWAGRIADSFYIDLSLLGMVNSAVRTGCPGYFADPVAKNRIGNDIRVCMSCSFLSGSWSAPGQPGWYGALKRASEQRRTLNVRSFQPGNRTSKRMLNCRAQQEVWPNNTMLAGCGVLRTHTRPLGDPAILMM